MTEAPKQQCPTDTTPTASGGDAQGAMNRKQVAKIFAYIWHGDIEEWRGFLSKADAFLAYPVTRPHSPVIEKVDGDQS
jgi:hypothetical protein